MEPMGVAVDVFVRCVAHSHEEVLVAQHRVQRNRTFLQELQIVSSCRANGPRMKPRSGGRASCRGWSLEAV